jgi:hypothetical protein
VVHFDLIHPLDPQTLGKKVLIAAMFVAAVPNSIIGIYLTLHDKAAAKVVLYVTKGQGSKNSVVPYNFLCVAFWAILSISMSLFSIIYIHFKLTKNKINNASIRAGEAQSVKKSPNIMKLFVVFVIFLFGLISLFIYNMIENMINFSFYVLTLVPTAVLLFFILEAEIVQYILKKMSNKYSKLKPTFSFTAKVSPQIQSQI